MRGSPVAWTALTDRNKLVLWSRLLGFEAQPIEESGLFYDLNHLNHLNNHPPERRTFSGPASRSHAACRSCCCCCCCLVVEGPGLRDADKRGCSQRIEISTSLVYVDSLLSMLVFAMLSVIDRLLDQEYPGDWFASRILPRGGGCGLGLECEGFLGCWCL